MTDPWVVGKSVPMPVVGIVPKQQQQRRLVGLRVRVRARVKG
jgi:hypothetical protein